MKKILVLVLSCNLPNYDFKEDIIRNTWWQIAKEHENVSGCFFYKSALDGNRRIDYSKDIVYVPGSDYRDRSFQKMMKTIFYMEELGYEYDYILRLNISTYPNIKLMERYVQEITDETSFFTGSIIEQRYFSPQGLPFTQGEYMLMSKYNINLLKLAYKANMKMFDDMEKHPNNSGMIFLNDDGWVTKVLSDYYLTTSNMDMYLDKIHSLGICHEPELALKKEHIYKNYPCVNYKIEFNKTDAINLRESDKYTKYDEYYQKKISKIHDVVTKSNWDVDEQIEILNKRLDTQCYTWDIMRTGLFRVSDNSTVSKKYLAKKFMNEYKLSKTNKLYK